MAKLSIGKTFTEPEDEKKQNKNQKHNFPDMFPDQ